MRFGRVASASAIAFVWAALATHAGAQQVVDPGRFAIFDEVRIGAVVPVQPNDDSGITLSGQVYFRALVHRG
jgi:hypothetical protein